MQFTKTKYFLMPLAILFYINFMFILGDLFSIIPFKLYKYDFYLSILNYAKPLSLFYLNANNYLNIINIFFEYFIYFIIFIGLIAILYPFIKTDILDFKENKSKFSSSIAISFLIYYAINVFVNLFITIISVLTNNVAESQNQVQLENLINTSSFYSLIMFFPIVVMGPLVEELIFRKCLFSLIKNKILALIISCLCFALLHTISYDYNFIDFILVTLPYFTAGIAFGFCYIKTNNIICSYLLHAGLNLISFVLIILM